MLVEDIKRLGPLGMGDGDKKGRGIETGGGDGARPQFLNARPVARFDISMWAVRDYRMKEDQMKMHIFGFHFLRSHIRL